MLHSQSLATHTNKMSHCLQLNDLIAATAATNYFDAMPQEIQKVILEEKLHQLREINNIAMTQLNRDFHDRHSVLNTCIEMDEDGEYSPEYIEELRNQINDDNCDEYGRISAEFENEMPDECRAILYDRAGFTDDKCALDVPVALASV